MRVPWIAEVLRDAGLTVREYGGWKGRGRQMRTVYGVVVHDTVTTTAWTDARVRALLRDGYTGLPGPLAQLGVPRDGTVDVIADGRCHHNGYGTWGNDSIGIEVYAAGGLSGREERWNDRQYETVAVASRAILDRLNLGRSSLWNPRVAGHKETDPARKIDPWGIDCNRLRRDVAEGDIMATLDDDDIRNIAEATADRVWAEIIGHGADMRASTLLSRLQGGGIDDVLDAVGQIPARTAGRIAADLPDGSDVVWTADNDVDEGIAMAAAQASGGTYRRWGGDTIDAEHVAAVGRVGDVADVGSGEVTVLQGADRGETAGLAVGFASRLLAES